MKNSSVLISTEAKALHLAMTCLELHRTSFQEPYILAAHALAAMRSGGEPAAASSLQQLRDVELREGVPPRSTPYGR